MTNPWLKPRLLPFAVAAFIVTGVLATSAPGSAQNCSESTPAKAVTTLLWGSLRPGDISLQGQPVQLPDDRDSTDYTGNNLPNQFRPLYSSVEAENGWAFTSYADGFRIWDISGANAERPAMVSAGDIRSGAGCTPSGFWIQTPPFTFGWMFLNLNTTVAGGFFNPTKQAWVTTEMDASGRFSVGYDAIKLDGANQTFQSANPGGTVLIP